MADIALKYLQQLRPVQEYEKLETAPDKPVSHISISVDQSDSQTTNPENNPVQNDMVGRGPDIVNGQRGLPGLNPSQQVPDSSSRSPKKVVLDALEQEHNTFGTLGKDYPRFGPCHGVDTDSTVVKRAKDYAWEQVVKMTGGTDEKIKGDYRRAIKGNVEKKAQEFYGDPIVKPLKTKFREIMVKDGCFFLQLALYILGCSKQLGYPEQHAYFGENGNEQTNRESKTRNWIRAMFFVRNQIPCVVLDELMKQSFFQEVIRGVTWDPPLDLPQLVLYLVVVEPTLDKNARGPTSRKLFGKRTPYTLKETPSDVLHCLHTLILGNWHNPLHSQDWKIEEDLESGMEEFDKKNKFPSASEIKASGIRLRKADGGIRKIHFRKRFLLLGYLYVPPFTWDADTDLMLRNLKSYEGGQQQGKAKREVSAYLRFMRDLIQTPKDVSILEHKGIIQVKRPDLKEQLPGILSKIVSPEEVSYTQNLRLTRLKVTEYRNPPCYLISWALIFTLIQTVFTILQYFEPRG